MKKSLLVSAAMAATLTSSSVFADLTGNIGVASNYVWRGMTQSLDQAAISGGVDWSHDSGAYAGTWVSNVDFSGDPGTGYEDGTGYELDYYVGYAGDAGDIGYDVGLVAYNYPVTPEFNFLEAYVSGSMSMFTLGINMTIENASGNDGGLFADGDMYVSLNADVTDTISLYAGSYMFDLDPGPGVEIDYIHFGASISKDDFTFALDKNDFDPVGGGVITANNVRATVSWAKEFEL